MPKIYCYLLLSVAILLCSETRAFAQQVNKKALEKANWYTSPREFQIIDDRPVVKDFREGPQQTQTVDVGGGPAGAGGNGNIPAGGMHFGKPSVRTESSGLPRSSFGSNIPAGGVGSSSALPGAGLRSYAGQLAHPTGLSAAGNHSYVPHRGGSVSTPHAPAAVVSAPAARSYSSYRSTVPITKSSSSSEQLNVRGKLLRGQ
jgi:hypothetical protein